MKSINKILFTNNFNNKYKRFIEELNNVNSKYQEYFNSRNSKSFPQEKDSLELHYWIINQYGNLTFGFLPESDINENIKNECIKLFHEIFNNDLD